MALAISAQPAAQRPAQDLAKAHARAAATRQGDVGRRKDHPDARHHAAGSAHCAPIPADAVPGAGYVAGIDRLGVPALKETDAAGRSYVMGLRKDGDRAALGRGQAASWNPDLLYKAAR
jgi:beta-glucosidase